MSNILENLTTQTTNTIGAENSAIVLINGMASRQQAAIDAALALGATEAQVAGMQAQVDALRDSSSALAAAVAANPGNPTP